MYLRSSGAGMLSTYSYFKTEQSVYKADFVGDRKKVEMENDGVNGRAGETSGSTAKCGRAHCPVLTFYTPFTIGPSCIVQPIPHAVSYLCIADLGCPVRCTDCPVVQCCCAV